MSVNGSARIRNFQYHWLSVRLQYLSQRQGVEILRLVIGDLLTVHGQSLCEISVTIQETYGT